MLRYQGPQNVLLRAAQKANRPELARRLKHAVFEAGHQFWKPRTPIPYALFPVRGIISLRLSPEPGRLVEVAVVGREGVAGVPLFFGLDDPLMIPVALTGGEAVLMPPDVCRAYFQRPVFQVAVERYLVYCISMLGRISVCNRIHVIEQLFVGRLLLLHDRIQTDSFHVTQEDFAQMLGVRRATLCQIAIALRKAGAIEYDRRGRMTIRNRHKLETHACSCYQAMKAVFDRMMRTSN